MENNERADLAAKILGILILFALVGIAPRPHAIRTGLERARRAQTFDSPRSVSAELAHLAEALPWWGNLWAQAGHAALKGGAPDEAITYFQRAAERGELTPQDNLALGDAYHQTGQVDSAIAAWERVDSSGHMYAEALPRLINAYLKTEAFGEARSALETLIASQGVEARHVFDLTSLEDSNYPLAYHLGLLLAIRAPGVAPPYLLQAAEIDSGLAAQATELAEAIQGAGLEESSSYTSLVAGQALAGQGRWDLAAHAFQRAVRLRPDYAEAWAYLGEAYQHIERGGDARPVLERALVRDPDSLAANAFLAIYWQRQGEFEKARAYLDQAAQLDPRNTALQIYLAELWAQQGDLDTAQTYFQAALDLARRDPAVWRAYADFCLRYNLDLHTKALPAARQAVLLDLDDPASLDRLGQVLFRLGDHLNAERLWRRALAQDSTQASTHLHLGFLYLFQDRPDLARSHLSLASSLAPASFVATQARRLLGQLP